MTSDGGGERETVFSGAVSVSDLQRAAENNIIVISISEKQYYVLILMLSADHSQVHINLYTVTLLPALMVCLSFRSRRLEWRLHARR